MFFKFVVLGSSYLVVEDEGRDARRSVFDTAMLMLVRSSAEAGGFDRC